MLGGDGLGLFFRPPKPQNPLHLRLIYVRDNRVSLYVHIFWQAQIMTSTAQYLPTFYPSSMFWYFLKDRSATFFQKPRLTNSSIACLQPYLSRYISLVVKTAQPPRFNEWIISSKSSMPRWPSAKIAAAVIRSNRSRIFGGYSFGLPRNIWINQS